MQKLLSQLYCQAIREGADAVIAVGGDGTLHEVHPISFLNSKISSFCLQTAQVHVYITKRKQKGVGGGLFLVYQLNFYFVFPYLPLSLSSIFSFQLSFVLRCIRP